MTLQHHAQAVQALQDQLTTAIEARDAAIRELHAQGGWTLRRLATVAGVSHGRISQILNHTER